MEEEEEPSKISAGPSQEEMASNESGETRGAKGLDFPSMDGTCGPRTKGSELEPQALG